MFPLDSSSRRGWGVRLSQVSDKDLLVGSRALRTLSRSVAQELQTHCNSEQAPYSLARICGAPGDLYGSFRFEVSKLGTGDNHPTLLSADRSHLLRSHFVETLCEIRPSTSRSLHWSCTLNDMVARSVSLDCVCSACVPRTDSDLPDSRREYGLSMQTGVWHESAHCDLSKSKFNQEIRVRLHVQTAQTFTGPSSVSLTKECLSVHAHTLNRSERMLNCSFLEHFLDPMIQRLIVGGKNYAGSSFSKWPDVTLNRG
jgi:hypothetical protein